MAKASFDYCIGNTWSSGDTIVQLYKRAFYREIIQVKKASSYQIILLTQKSQPSYQIRPRPSSMSPSSILFFFTETNWKLRSFIFQSRYIVWFDVSDCCCSAKKNALVPVAKTMKNVLNPWYDSLFYLVMCDQTMVECSHSPQVLSHLSLSTQNMLKQTQCSCMASKKSHDNQNYCK